ncbi:hypothetical protein JCM5353_004507 [Sporobolomyces roseus]
MNTNTPAKPEVFQSTLLVERTYLKQTIKAVLGTILFHRVCGQIVPSSFDFLGISFPVPADAEVEAILESKSEAFTRLLLDGSNAVETKSAKVCVALYPIPVQRPSTSSNPGRSASPAPAPISPSRAREREASNTRRTSLAAPVSSALNWLSSARGLLGGEGLVEAEVTELDEELALAKEMEKTGKGAWEGWSIEIEVLRESRRGIDGEEKLRSQLNDFLLRSLSFAMHRTSHIPPITSSELMPYGILILLDPPTPPFPIPKPVISEVKGFPVLHKTLVSGSSGKGMERRSTSVR